ncbi:MAG: H/ACA ribonucleoprotein complex subunit GAR1 [Thermoplasmatota archaeon]
MKIIGRIVNISSDGSLVVRSRNAHEIGSIVVDRGSERIGRISRVTGSVSSPYVIITPPRDKREDLGRLMGKDVFLQDKRDREKGAGGSKREGKRTSGPGKGRGSSRGQRERDGGHFQKGGGRAGTGKVHKVKLARKRR